jgi:hypothetical protein
MPQKTQVRILMLTDAEGTYTEELRFGLTELVSALESTSGVFAEFKVTKAHREVPTDTFIEPASADIKEFEFDNLDQFNPSNYDEIWIFGIRKQFEGKPLTPSELKVVAQFMDQGGGVFAVGDHEDLGRPLCGEIPRVRSMRRWTYKDDQDPEAYDPNSGQGPPVYGSFRHDTLVSGHSTLVAGPGTVVSGIDIFTFDDQSDDIPQTIYPKMYGISNSYFPFLYPHPILCGPRGVINVLPDHMHEGWCVVPKDLSQSYTFEHYVTEEYPSGSSGQIIPDVIAEGEVFAHATDNTDIQGKLDVPSKATKFGNIGAYDGHPVNVGRVVVDSTFHHFVNINVIASGANSSDPVKQKGFGASQSGREAYDQIRAYWRNIAIWLAPAAKQNSMFSRVLWAARWDSQVGMAGASTSRRETLSWGDMVRFGGSVRTTLRRFVTPCARQRRGKLW